MFRSLVHARNISSVQKLQLLKSAVKSNAASVLGRHHERLESRLRQSLKEAWNLRRPISGLPSLRDLLTFLSARARAKAIIPKNVPSTVRARTSTQNSESRKSSRTAKQVRKEAQCPLCKAFHGLYRCPDFLSLSLRAHAWRLFGNCLNAGHRASECKRGDCRSCQKPHNSVMCPDGSAAESSGDE